MANIPYIGNGPYCYTYCLSMIFGPEAPSAAVIEFATCSAFGMQIIDGLPFFDPEGWDPLLEETLKRMGWIAEKYIGPDAEQAIAKLRLELQNGPVFVGPVSMAGLTYAPGPPDADHFVVVTAIDGDTVTLHDPNGFPYVMLPLKDFIWAWGAPLPYGAPFTMCVNFVKKESVSEEEIITRTIPQAQKWLSVENSRKAAETAAALMSNLRPGLRGHLTEFAIRVGARRVADAATCLSRVKGYTEAVTVLDEQARLLGSLQYFVKVKNTSKAAEILNKLGATYQKLEQALNAGGQ